MAKYTKKKWLSVVIPVQESIPVPVPVPVASPAHEKLPSRAVYITAPRVVLHTDRYEKYRALISQQFAGRALLESREVFPRSVKRDAWREQWHDLLHQMSTLVFIRNHEKCIGFGTFHEVWQAHRAGKAVFLAVTSKDDQLMLIPWGSFKVKMMDKSDGRNYAKITLLPQALVRDDKDNHDKKTPENACQPTTIHHH